MDESGREPREDREPAGGFREDPTEDEPRKREGRRRGGGLRRALRMAKPVLAGLVVALVLVLVFQNQEPVRTRLLMWEVEMPRFFLLAVVYCLGVVTGWVVFWRSSRPRR